ncbi:MAG: endolytic transglycosylase MltG [Pseudomonadota bacterium]
MKRRLIYGLAGLIVLCAAAGGAGLQIRAALAPASAAPRETAIDIPPGTSLAEIGLALQKAGIIRSGKAFRYLAAYKKVGAKIKAGEHLLDSSLSAADILNRLVQGSYKLYRLTIPEGLNQREIAELAARAGLASRQEFLNLCHDRAFIASLGLDDETLEGYLFPETYFFTKGTPAPKIIQAMVDRFHKIWAGFQGQTAPLGLDRKQVVTLASIVEKETGAAAERPLVAAVFLNRLKKGMRLETDPAVIYGIPDFDGNLTRKHLETPTPYNTYAIAGLPPGPIANPGEASIRAVFEPADVDYLFFVSKNDGSHFFSKNLHDHVNAVNRYQRQGRSGL